MDHENVVSEGILFARLYQALTEDAKQGWEEDLVQVLENILGMTILYAQKCQCCDVASLAIF